MRPTPTEDNQTPRADGTTVRWSLGDACGPVDCAETRARPRVRASTPAGALRSAMVRLTKIYTRTGDDGTTGLATGERIRKDSLRVETYGTLDEANAALGVAILHAHGTPLADAIGNALRPIQHDLFDLGADLATPIDSSTPEAPGSRLRIVASQTERLEQTIDRFNDPLPPLNSFVLPGGSPLAAFLHVVRTVVRRAERLAVHLLAAETGSVNPETVRYLNRLSDLLFVLGRVANENGDKDVLWVPGANR